MAASNVTAAITRQDVANAYGISGYNAFGFSAYLPNSYKIGVPLTISIKYAGTSTNIPGSPKVTSACNNYGVLSVDPNCFTQTARFFPGSGEARIGAVARTGTISLQLSAKGSGSIQTLTSKLIPIKQGDNFSLDAYAFTPTLTKRNLTPQITTAVVGGVLTGLALTQRQTTAPDQRHFIQPMPAIGLSTTLMVPLVKSLSANRLPKATVELAFYDKKGKFIHRQQVSINKTARNDWQLLHIEGRTSQDGYAVVRLQNTSKTPVYFDDLHFEAKPNHESNTAKTNAGISKLLISNQGFAPQLPIDDQSVYQTSSYNYNDCGGGSGNDDPSDGGIKLPEVIVTAPIWQPIDISDTKPTITPETPVSIPADPSSGGGQTTDDSTPKPKFLNQPLCQTLDNVWNQSFDADGNPSVENMLLQTNKGTLVFPTSGKDCSGTYHQNTVSFTYTDYFGSFSTSTDANGDVSTILPLCDGTTATVYGAIHTHPSTSAGNPFAPSPADENWAKNHPEVECYILGKDELTQNKVLLHYDQNGNPIATMYNTDPCK